MKKNLKTSSHLLVVVHFLSLTVVKAQEFVETYEEEYTTKKCYDENDNIVPCIDLSDTDYENISEDESFLEQEDELIEYDEEYSE